MENKEIMINGVSFNMILVEAGTFEMGSEQSNVSFSESPVHPVTLTDDYWMAETEITEDLWSAVVKGKGNGSSYPKTSITWNNAHAFIDQLNEIAHETNAIEENEYFCLPTEAEWEYAAKGGNKSKGYLYSGSNDINEVAVTYENSGSSSPIRVKTKKPNELGLYDMSGNAYEWVDDYAYDYSDAAQRNPHNTSKSNLYIKRGGSNYHSYADEPYLFTTTGRYFYGSTDWTIGFRIALKQI